MTSEVPGLVVWAQRCIRRHPCTDVSARLFWSGCGIVLGTVGPQRRKNGGSQTRWYLKWFWKDKQEPTR